jgi:hypothetical protein
LIMFCFIRIDILVGAQKNDIQLGDHFLPWSSTSTECSQSHM